MMNDQAIRNAVAPVATGVDTFVTAGAGSIAKTPQLTLAKHNVLDGRSIQNPMPIHLNDAEIMQAVGELQRRRDQVTEDYLRWARGQKFPTREEQILGVLKRGAISITQSGFNNAEKEKVMLERIKAVTQRGLPLYLPLLLGGIKAPNPLKTGLGVLPDLAEWQAWLQLDAIAKAINGFVVPIPDATLLGAVLEFDRKDIEQHMSQSTIDLKMLGLDKRIIMPDTSSFLPPEWPKEVQALSDAIRERSKSDGVTDRHLRDQAWSLQFITNVRKFRLKEEEQVLLGAALSGDRAGTSHEILELADYISAKMLDQAPMYMAVNEAIRVLDLAGRIVEGISGNHEHFRISVHAKTYEPRPRLVFARNRLVASMALLPMHGVGVRAEIRGQFEYGIGFDLVQRMEGAKRVFYQGRFLWFEPAANDLRLASS